MDNLNPAAAVPWQHFIYLSYITLTIAGYGDMLPITPWARSLTHGEMVIGVLYVTIIWVWSAHMDKIMRVPDPAELP